MAMSFQKLPVTRQNTRAMLAITQEAVYWFFRNFTTHDTPLPEHSDAAKRYVERLRPFTAPNTDPHNYESTFARFFLALKDIRARYEITSRQVVIMSDMGQAYAHWHGATKKCFALILKCAITCFPIGGVTRSACTTPCAPYRIGMVSGVLNGATGEFAQCQSIKQRCIRRERIQVVKDRSVRYQQRHIAPVGHKREHIAGNGKHIRRGVNRANDRHDTWASVRMP